MYRTHMGGEAPPITTILPCDESFVPNRPKLFGSIFFVWATLGLRPFRFHHRNSEMFGLFWTLLDSVGLELDSGATSQIIILRPDDAKKVLSRWTRSNRVQHEFTIEILRFLDSPRLGFYKVRRNPARGMESKPSPTLYWGPVTLMGYTPKNIL